MRNAPIPTTTQTTVPKVRSRPSSEAATIVSVERLLASLPNEAAKGRVVAYFMARHASGGIQTGAVHPAEHESPTPPALFEEKTA